MNPLAPVTRTRGLLCRPEVSAELEFNLATEDNDHMADKSNNGVSGVGLAVSIVLYCPDKPLLGATLRSLGKALAHARDLGLDSAEVILTDHSPRPQPDEHLTDWRLAIGKGTKLRYEYNVANPGFGAGHNSAFFRRPAGADFFLVANPDLEFDPDSIAVGIDFLVAHPRVGLLAPALIEPQGGLRPACFRYPDLRTLALRAVGIGQEHPRVARYECRDWDAMATNFDPPLVSGCCMLFRSETYALLKGFDPAYFLYFEDFDLSWRAGRNNLSVYLPAMKVAHAGGNAGSKGWHHRVCYFRSALRFFVTNGWRW